MDDKSRILGDHCSESYRESHPSFHYYVWKEEFGFLKDLWIAIGSCQPGKKYAKFRSLLEQFGALLLRSIMDKYLAYWLPENASARKEGYWGLNVAQPLDQGTGYAPRSFSELASSNDAKAREYHRWRRTESAKKPDPEKKKKKEEKEKANAQMIERMIEIAKELKEEAERKKEEKERKERKKEEKKEKLQEREQKIKEKLENGTSRHTLFKTLQARERNAATRKIVDEIVAIVPGNPFSMKYLIPGEAAQRLEDFVRGNEQLKSLIGVEDEPTSKKPKREETEVDFRSMRRMT